MPPHDIEPSEIHCCGCGRFLGLAAIAVGIVQLKCPKCKKWTTIQSWPNEVDSLQELAYNAGVKAT